ncbi:MAG: ABC transporter permease subunit [TACK group archaeon]|nr:ABC transporter permease subunit [TACK group archaeon]
MTNGVLYDFRRSLFRPSLIVLVILFVAAGVGIAYLDISTMGISQPSYYVVYGYPGPAEANSSQELLGYLFNQQGTGLGGATLYLTGGKAVTNSSGYFHWESSPTQPLMIGAPVTFSFRGSNHTASAGFDAIVGINLASHSAIFIVGARPGLFIYFKQSKSFPSVTTNSPSEYAKMTDLGVATSPIFRHVIALNASLPFVSYAEVNSTTGLVLTSGSNEIYQLLMPTGYASVLFNSATIFAEFFPIMAFYLVYAMFVSPRATGALEFILARPVTKRGLFTARYLGGALTLLVSAGIVAAALGLTVAFLLGVQPTYSDIGLIFAGLSVELLAFFSLSFLIGTWVRGTGSYLGISIAAFIFFFMGIFDLIVLLENLPNLYYLDPRGLYDMIASFGTSSNTSLLFPYSSPLTVAVAAVLWIVLPLLGAMISYERQRVA